jgi:hypothetical protein
MPEKICTTPRISPRLAKFARYFHSFVHFFPSFSYEFDSRYPLQYSLKFISNLFGDRGMSRRQVPFVDHRPWPDR